jgi:hypothetical protein
MVEYEIGTLGLDHIIISAVWCTVERMEWEGMVMLQNCIYLLKGGPDSCNENEVSNKEVGKVTCVEEEESPTLVTFTEIKFSLCVFC